MSQSYAKSPAAERKFTTREMVLVGMFAAVLAVISQISLPMPTGVPITIQVFGVALVGAVLGSRLGTTATLVYVLLGAIGLPIFANFSGGISSEQQVQVQTQYYTDPKYVLLSLAVTAILAVLGCMISNKLIVKHFRKSGAIK